MEKENLIIAYDGKALENHEIDVEELALSLTGMAGLIKHASSVVNRGQSTKISIKVSSLSPGSFEIHLVAEQIKEVLAFWGTNPKIVGLSTILSLLGLSGVGLIQLILALKNNKIKKAKENEDGDIVITYIENNTTNNITINKNVYTFYNDNDIRNSLSKVLSPLSKEGIDTFEVRDSKKSVKGRITKDELSYFSISPQNDLLDENELDMWLSFISISFKDGNKWRFSNGDNEFYASVDDQDFANSVNSDMTKFSKNDTIKAKVKISQYLTENGIKTLYSIVKILEYKSVTQLRLDLYNETDEG
jgi:hypothetical protein